MFVGDGDQHFAKGQPACQRLDPDLLGCRGLRIGQFGLLQATSCALYQQRAQVIVAAAADAAQARLATTGVLRRSSSRRMTCPLWLVSQMAKTCFARSTPTVFVVESAIGDFPSI